MATVYTVPNDFVTDTVAVADQVDANFNAVLAAVNALDAGNLASGTVALARISGLTSSQMAAAFFKDEDDMASDSETAVSSQQAIKAYIATAIAFGSWASKSNNTEYTAASDGFVVAKATGDQQLKMYTPTATLRIHHTVLGSGADVHSSTLPVRSGDTWKVT